MDLFPTGEHGELIATSVQRNTSIGIFCSKEYYNNYQAELTAAWKKEFPQDCPLFFSINRLPGEPRAHKLERPYLRAETIKI
jgi:hypothetical protein